MIFVSFSRSDAAPGNFASSARACAFCASLHFCTSLLSPSSSQRKSSTTFTPWYVSVTGFLGVSGGAANTAIEMTNKPAAAGKRIMGRSPKDEFAASATSVPATRATLKPIFPSPRDPAILLTQPVFPGHGGPRHVRTCSPGEKRRRLDQGGNSRRRRARRRHRRHLCHR